MALLTVTSLQALAEPQVAVAAIESAPAEPSEELVHAYGAEPDELLDAAAPDRKEKIASVLATAPAGSYLVFEANGDVQYQADDVDQLVLDLLIGLRRIDDLEYRESALKGSINRAFESEPPDWRYLHENVQGEDLTGDGNYTNLSGH